MGRRTHARTTPPEVDDRGYSVADHLLKTDEGSVNGLAMPAVATEARKLTLHDDDAEGRA